MKNLTTQIKLTILKSALFGLTLFAFNNGDVHNAQISHEPVVLNISHEPVMVGISHEPVML